MMEGENKITLTQDFQKGYLSLPFNEEQFKHFISGLLGKPQTIEKVIGGNFIIYLKDIQIFNDLLSQRIAQQNNGHLVQFSAKVYFNDRSSVSIFSFVEFITYNEIKPVVSESIIVTWIYLIQFPDKSYPEKQEITLEFISSIPKGQGSPYLNSSSFKISIRHTARSWGYDIETLLTNQIHSIDIPQNPYLKFVSKRRYLIAGIIALLCFLFGISPSMKKLHEISEMEKSQLRYVLATEELSEKMNYIIAEKTRMKVAKFNENIPPMVFMFIFAIVAFTIVLYTAKLYPKSFLVLTREGEKEIEFYKKEYSNKMKWFVVSLILSILTGILVNYLTSYFFP